MDSGLTKERIRKKEKVIKKIEDGEWDEARKMAIRFQPHSIVARQILNELAPEGLPTPDEEFRWLVADFIDHLNVVYKNLEKYPDDDDLRKEEDELLWSLAVLVENPPPGISYNLADILNQLGLLELVTDRSQRLVE